MMKNTKGYSRTSVARTLIARLPRLFQTRFESLGKYLIAGDLELSVVIFLFIFKNGILCVHIRIASMR